MESIWSQSVQLPEFPVLEGDTQTEVLIVGGGLAGLLCAHELASRGVDCLLVEQNRICGGVTKNTTAKLTAQHGLIYDKLTKSLGKEAAGLYLRANLVALERICALARGIGCALEEKSAVVYSLRGAERIERERAALAALGYQAEPLRDLPLPFAVDAALRFPLQAQFHPLEFAAGLLRGLPVREQTCVLELRGDTAITNRGNIRAKHFIVATHFPFMNKHGAYFLKLYQSRSYVVALENAAQVEGMYVDEAQKGLSFRNHGALLLIGGGGHRTGKKGGGWQELRDFAARHYPEAKEVAAWATQDCMSLDGVPYIGRYASGLPNVYVAAGFNKWGMTSSVVAAGLLADLVTGVPNAFEVLFSPQRSMLHAQLLANSAEAVVNLCTPTTPRCPHMGCALKWNEQEHSWDCPCHGSRFGEDGRLLDNPATGPLKRSQSVSE